MKDHATLIEAASLLISSGYKVKFLLAGRGVDSDNETLVSIINACALKEHVYLLGEVDDMVSFLNSLDVFCLSSIFGEGFPNVLGEAMSCGVPCVSTDVGDAKYIIGDTGLIVPHSSTYEMTEAFKQIITQVRDFRSVMQVNSKNRISENYSIHSSFEKYNQFYDAVYLG